MAGSFPNEIQPAGWNQPCSEAHLAVIGDSIIDWRAVSPFLGLTEAEEIAILESTHSVPARKIAMLRKWKQKRGAKATYKRLCHALKTGRFTDLVEMIKQLLTESSSSDEEDSSSNLLLSDPLTPYASYLKGMYSSMSHSNTSQHWAHLPRCEFIQLAMIKDETMRRGGREEEMIRLAQQGKIETILGRKKNLAIDQIFLPDKSCNNCPPPPPVSPSFPSTISSSHDFMAQLLDKLLRPNPRTILIEGAPGGGKSTLALHICHQWALGVSWLEKFVTVVLVYLRDEAVQDATVLADILPGRNLEMCEIIASQLQANNGNNVLFIFDGWDEFPLNLMKNSLVSTIIYQPQKLSLHQCTVLITSRPVASGNLLHIADRRVEILGFTQNQIHDYIKKALKGNSSHIQTLIQHLEAYPLIKGYCYIPLHAAILVHVFVTMEGALPTTHRELYCFLILCCIAREYATHEPVITLPELTSLDDLPDELKSKLKNLCVLAYNGVMQDKVVFNLKDLQNLNLPSDLPSLGLLQAVEGLTLCSKNQSYNFLHLSVQELLAAYHISHNMPSCEQVKIFKRFFGRYRFEAVLHYYCGFTKLENPEILEFISFLNRMNQFHRFDETLLLLHCFLGAQQPSLCKLVDLTDINLNFASIRNPIDYLAIGYYITSQLSTSTDNMPPIQLFITCRDTDDYYLKLLLDELSKYTVEKRRSSRKLAFTLGWNYEDEKYCDKDCSDEDYNDEDKDYSDEDKDYSYENYNDEDKDYSYEDYNDEDKDYSDEDYCDDDEWGFSDYHYVEPQSINGQGAKHIAAHLKASPAIAKLVLHEAKIQWDDDGLFYIAEALQTNSSLIILKLDEVHLEHTEKNGSALIKMLQVNKSLKCLDLSNSVFYDSKLFYCIFEGLRHNAALTYLSLNNTHVHLDDPVVARSLTAMLQENKSLTYFNLSNNNVLLQRAGACCLFESLERNTVLTYLLLTEKFFFRRDGGIPDTIKSLGQLLQINKSLIHLNLSKATEFLEPEVCCIFEGVQHNTALLKLVLSDTAITATDPDTARSITKMLQVNKSLTHLDLSSNQSFSNIGANYIFEGLQCNSTLVNLNLTNIGMTTEVVESLTNMLGRNNSLKFLNISRNNLSDSGVQRIFECLQHNTALVKLSLRQTSVTTTNPDTASALAKVICVNKSLTHLDLSRNDIHESSQESDSQADIDFSLNIDETHERIRQAIIWSHSPQKLNIYFSSSSEEGIRFILKSLKFKAFLQLLSLNKVLGTKLIFEDLKHRDSGCRGYSYTELDLIPDPEGQFSY